MTSRLYSSVKVKVKFYLFYLLQDVRRLGLLLVQYGPLVTAIMSLDSSNYTDNKILHARRMIRCK